LDPEILIVDEVLAVGDAQFQKKCLGKMEEVGKEGRTILFVSHNMAYINNLCSDCILLSSGQVSKRGHPSSVIQEYLAQSENAFTTTSKSDVILADQDLDLLVFCSSDGSGNPKRCFTTSENIDIHIRYLAKRDIPGLRVGVDLVSFSDGEILFRTFDDDTRSKTRKKGIEEAICSIPSNLLKPGIYAVRVQIGIHNIRWIFDGPISEKISVELVDGVNSSYADYRPGKIMPRVEWS
jgi:lipopolysaccharide transport system ATP-binding protein